MKNTPQIDVRADQLKLLKLEQRQMRPMARTLLDCTKTKSAKLMAISACAVTIASLHDAPVQYAEKIGAGLDDVTPSVHSISAACSLCGTLQSLVAGDGDRAAIEASLVDLFHIVQTEHENFEKLARATGGRLIGDWLSPKAGSSGIKELPKVWLTQVITQGFNSSR